MYWFSHVDFFFFDFFVSVKYCSVYLHDFDQNKECFDHHDHDRLFVRKGVKICTVRVNLFLDGCTYSVLVILIT